MSNPIGSMLDHMAQDPVSRALSDLRRQVAELQARLSRVEDAIAAGAAPTSGTPVPAVAAPTSPWAAPRLMPTTTGGDPDPANLNRVVVEPPPIAPEALPSSPTSLGFGAARQGATAAPASASDPPTRRSGT